MIKQYFKQSLVLLQQNKLLSVIAIIGTALAIAMIMCIVLTAHFTSRVPSGVAAKDVML